MTKLKTISIKGKAYVEVKERLKHFRKTYQHEYGLVTNVLTHNSDSILIKAEIIDKKTGFVIADGIAFEESASSFINKGNYVENCQTSAWGRALGNFGIGLDSSVSSYEESANWKLNDVPVKPVPVKVKVDLDQKGTKEVIDIEKMLKYIAAQKIKSLPAALKMLADNDYIITNEVEENVSFLFKTKK
tara:strand:+ start:2638 stop:3201 length:564 start_codon:yes stop_codon:yes gene_type:complete